jgi:hypothetical protein
LPQARIGLSNRADGGITVIDPQGLRHRLEAVAYRQLPAASIPPTLQPAGLDKSVGLVTAAFLKEPGDPTWKDDPEVAEYVRS